jgi:hypothetical protein
MPSDMDAPARHPKDFSHPIHRLELRVQRFISVLFRTRRRLIIFFLGLSTIFIFYRVFLSGSSTTPESHDIPLPSPAVVYTVPDHGEKYFHESPEDSHRDVRFSIGIEKGAPLPNDALVHLIRSFILTMRSLNVTPWLAHGTLLGWHWGHKLLPWVCSLSSLLFLLPCVLMSYLRNVLQNDGSQFLSQFYSFP